MDKKIISIIIAMVTFGLIVWMTYGLFLGTAGDEILLLLLLILPLMLVGMAFLTVSSSEDTKEIENE